MSGSKLHRSPPLSFPSVLVHFPSSSFFPLLTSSVSVSCHTFLSMFLSPLSCFPSLSSSSSLLPPAFSFSLPFSLSPLPPSPFLLSSLPTSSSSLSTLPPFAFLLSLVLLPYCTTLLLPCLSEFSGDLSGESQLLSLSLPAGPGASR